MVLLLLPSREPAANGEISSWADAAGTSAEAKTMASEVRMIVDSEWRFHPALRRPLAAGAGIPAPAPVRDRRDRTREGRAPARRRRRTPLAQHRAGRGHRTPGRSA